MIGLGLMCAVMASMTIYVVRTRMAATYTSARAIAQIPTATELPPQHPEDCKVHEVFRVSDRRCYVLQGE